MCVCVCVCVKEREKERVSDFCINNMMHLFLTWFEQYLFIIRSANSRNFPPCVIQTKQPQSKLHVYDTRLADCLTILRSTQDMSHSVTV